MSLTSDYTRREHHGDGKVENNLKDAKPSKNLERRQDNRINGMFAGGIRFQPRKGPTHAFPRGPDKYSGRMRPLSQLEANGARPGVSNGTVCYPVILLSCHAFSLRFFAVSASWRFRFSAPRTLP